MAVTRQALPALPAAESSRLGARSAVPGEFEGRRGDRAFPLAAARLLLDATAIGLAVAMAFPLRFRWHALEATPGALDLGAHLIVASLWLVGVLGPMASHRLYDEDTLAPGGQEITRIRRSLLEGVALVSTAVFLLRLVAVSRGWFFLVVVLSALFLAAERRAAGAAVRLLRTRGALRRRAILVCTPDHASAEELALREFDVIAAVRPEGLPTVLVPAERRSGRRERAPVVIVDGSAGLAHDELWRLVLDAGDAGSAVFLMSPVRQLSADRLSTRTLGARTIVKVAPPTIMGVRAAEKRLLDVAASVALLIVLAIPMGLIALAVILTSGRPILYGQQRVGRDGRAFTMWKFRTMSGDAEEEAGPVWATAGDPRRTPIGAILRRSSLDELPQLGNVLRGHMSIVGPRPERPVFVARFDEGNPWYRFRHRIRPGITGLAQVRGLRGDTPVEPRVESDNWYIENWSLGLDIRIAARTLLAMLRGRNAH